MEYRKDGAYTLSEKYLLKTAFEAPVVLYTYTKGIKIDVKAVMKYEIHGTVGEVIRKIDVMFAVPSSKLDAVRQGITIDKTVKVHNLRTPEKRRDRPVVVTDEQLLLGKGCSVRILMRSGHVLRGVLIRVWRYNVVLRVCGKIVVVYKHGILEYVISETSPISKD